MTGLQIGGAAQTHALHEQRPQARQPVVEVTADDAGTALIDLGELLRAQQQTGLALALLGGESEMQIENFQPEWRLASSADLDGGVLTAAPLQITDGEIDIAFADDGMAAQGGVAVAALAQTDVVPRGVIGVIERRGQFPGHVLLPGARRSFVDFLQEHDVRIVVAENADDAFGLKAPVEADGAMDVVGDDTQPGHRGPHLLCPGQLRRAPAALFTRPAADG